MRIHFKKPDDWKNAYIHYWNNSSADRSTQWPGEPINNNKDNWHDIEFNSDSSVNLVFNDGKDMQTNDLFLDREEAWFWNGCFWHVNPDIFRICTFPAGKYKALVMSYDDGSSQDKRLVEMFNNYGIKGTFHICSGKMKEPGIIKSNEVSSVYKGHEVSCHSVTHPNLSAMNEKELSAEILDDKKALEDLVGYKIRGLSYPFGSYNKLLLELLVKWGFVYGRVVPETGDFRLPGDLLQWQASCHHTKAWHLAEKFIASLSMRMKLFFIWGHSWEFNDSDTSTNNWPYMKKICAMLGNRNDIWYASAVDVAEYINAICALQIQKNKIYNPSALTVYIKHNNEIINVDSCKTIEL